MAEEIAYYRVVPATPEQEHELRHWQGVGTVRYPTWSTEHFLNEEQILEVIERHFSGWKIEVRKRILTDWEEKR